MGLIPARCTQCGAEIKVDSNKESGVCEHCGTPFITEKVINNTYVTNNFHGATVNIVNGDAKNYLKLAKTYLKSNSGEEAYIYASKALELEPNISEAWILKMYAIALCGKISNLNTKEIISCGQNAVNNAANVMDVFSAYLGIASEWLKIACQKIGDTTQLKLMIANGGTDLQMFASNDNEFRGLVYRYVDGALKLKMQVPVEVIEANSNIQKTIIVLTNQYVEFCRIDKNRCSLYGVYLKNSDVSSRKDCLQKMQMGLPDNLQIKEELYDNNSQSSNGKCYIATAVYGSYDYPSVCVLRRFRDENLSTNIFGKIIVILYYAISPYLVKCLGENKTFLLISKKILDRLVLKIKKCYRYGSETFYVDK